MAETSIARDTQLLTMAAPTLMAGYDKLVNNSVVDADGCRIVNYAVNKSGTTRKYAVEHGGSVTSLIAERGYPRLKLAGKMYFTHHIAFLAQYITRDARGIIIADRRNDPVLQARWVDAGYQLSHGCGKPRCGEMTCIYLESIAANKTRDFCHGYRYYIECGNCGAVNDWCLHEPQCKKTMGGGMPVALGTLIAPPAEEDDPDRVDQPEAVLEQLSQGIRVVEDIGPPEED